MSAICEYGFDQFPHKTTCFPTKIRVFPSNARSFHVFVLSRNCEKGLKSPEIYQA